MQVKIVEGCISCGLCVSVCPEVFQMGQEGTAEVISQPNEAQAPMVQEAAEGCPVSVIVTK